MKPIPNIILIAGLGLAAVHSCFAASSIFNIAGVGDLWVPESMEPPSSKCAVAATQFNRPD